MIPDIISFYENLLKKEIFRGSVINILIIILFISFIKHVFFFTQKRRVYLFLNTYVLKALKYIIR